MIETGQSNTYEIICHDKRKLLHQIPWYQEPGGSFSELIELAVDLLDQYPTFNRD